MLLDSYLRGCPCGFFGDPGRHCTCSTGAIERYQRKVSGPLLDRIDIHIQVPRVEVEKLGDKRSGERSEAIRQRVLAVRERQARRFEKAGILTNADMGPRELAALEPSNTQVRFNHHTTGYRLIELGNSPDHIGY